MSIIDLEQFRKNADNNNLCDEYARIWDGCKSKRQLMDMALGAKGVDYICDTIAKGWGISPEELEARFAPFINGRYVSEQKGYSSKMYCRYSGEITADTTLLCLIDTDASVYLPDNTIVEIYITGKSSVTLHGGNGRCACICYGKPSDISICSVGNVNYKLINKKERDRYE